MKKISPSWTWHFKIIGTDCVSHGHQWHSYVVSSKRTKSIDIYRNFTGVSLPCARVFLLSALYGEDTKHTSQKTSKFCRFLGEILEKPCYSF